MPQVALWGKGILYHKRFYNLFLTSLASIDSFFSWQNLLALESCGFEGKEAQELEAGSTVVIRPGTVHWHGASADSEFCHLSIIPNPKENKDTWLEAVSEEEYVAVNAKSSH